MKGTVVQFESSGALVDIGAKATAYMPTREVKRRNQRLGRESNCYIAHFLPGITIIVVQEIKLRSVVSVFVLCVY